MKQILLIHGPNINMLGKREPGIYGDLSYEKLNAKIAEHADNKGVGVEIYQSNHEGELVDKIQSAGATADLIIINPGAYTHTSVAIRDAILSIDTPVIEVHISNVAKREEFRKHSYVSDVAYGTITGFGPESYLLAISAGVDVIL